MMYPVTVFLLVEFTFVLGQAWDLCTRRKCRWFVITSYNIWVFGAFSRGSSTLQYTDSVLIVLSSRPYERLHIGAEVICLV